MDQSLTITGYVAATYEAVVDELENGGTALIESAARTSEERVAGHHGFAASIEAQRTGANDVTVRVEDESAQLDGALVTLAPVGGTANGVTELVLRLGDRFEPGDRGSRQFLAASTFVGAATRAFAKERTAA